MASAFGVTATNFTAQDVNELIKQASMTLITIIYFLFILKICADSLPGFIQEVMLG